MDAPGARCLVFQDGGMRLSRKGSAPKFTLYDLQYCPYCHYVREAAEELGIELRIVDVRRNPEARQYLISERGRGTVPVLGIVEQDGERLLGESRDIVRFLREHARQA